MALVGSISGSNSLVGISGSVIVANRPDASFPALPGADVVFFVSGSRESKGGAVRAVSVFGGDTVISGNLTVGTGSVTITSNEIQFAGGLARITSGSGGLTFFDSSNTGGKTLTDLAAGGGGGGDSVFTAASNIAAFTTSSIAIGHGTAASGKGADLFFFVSGSKDVGSNNAMFGGRLTASGTITVKDTSGNIVVGLSPTGVISGSSDLQAGGNLTVGGTSALVGVVSASDNLAVNGGRLSTTAASFSLLNTSATQVNFAGAGTTISIGAGSGNTTVNNNLTVAGNLTVNGTTTTVSSSNLTVADPVVLIGSGSVGPQAASVIAFSSGSTGTNDIIFGAYGGVLRAAAYNTTGGNLPYATLNNATTFSTLVQMQAGIFSPNDLATGLKDGANDIVLSGSSTKGVILQHGQTRAVSFNEDVTNYLKVGPRAAGSTDGVITATGDLYVSGNQNIFRSTTGLHQFYNIASSTGNLFINTLTSNQPRIEARDGGFVAKALTISGSNITLGGNTSGEVFFQKAGTTHFTIDAVDGGGVTLLKAASTLRIQAGSTNNIVLRNNAVEEFLTFDGTGGNTVVKGLTAKNVTLGTQGAAIMSVTGSSVVVNHGLGRFILQEDGTQYLGLDYTAGTTTTSISGSTNQSLVLASGLGSTTLTLSGSTVTHNAGVINFQKNGTTFAFVGSSPDANPLNGLFPNSDKLYNLGSPDRRWANIYTGDLHLRNERGDYTLIEEPDALTIRYNRTGKRYRILVERAPEYDG